MYLKTKHQKTMKFTKENLGYGAEFTNNIVHWKVSKIFMNMAKNKIQVELTSVHPTKDNKPQVITRFRDMLIQNLNSCTSRFYIPTYEIY